MRGSFSIYEWLKKVMLCVNMMHLHHLSQELGYKLKGGLALKMSFELCWQVDSINSVDKTNLLCFTALTSKWCFYLQVPRQFLMGTYRSAHGPSRVTVHSLNWIVFFRCFLLSLVPYSSFFSCICFKFFPFLGWAPCMGLSILFVH